MCCIRGCCGNSRGQKASAKLFDPPIEPVEIPNKNTTLPGYFHRVDRSDRKRPLLIIHSGFDGGSARKCTTAARVPPSSAATTSWPSLSSVTLPRTPHPIHLVVLLASRTSCSRTALVTASIAAHRQQTSNRTLPPMTCT